jgi:DNA integrity scanning protein DisA with diadenylate cyclase activity
MLLRSFGKIVQPMLATSESPFDRQVESLLSLHSFEDVFVAANMRGGAANLTSVALPVMVLVCMRRLITQRYEGQPYTSGFVFAKKWRSVAEHGRSQPFEVEPFDFPIPMTLGIFDSPATYRYVDGRNSFYLIGRDYKIHGIVRVKNPKSYGLVERSLSKHLTAFLTNDHIPWVAHVTANGHLQVTLKDQTYFRHTRSHWRYLDNAVLPELFESFGVESDVANAIASIALTISDLHQGTLMLVPSDPIKTPNLDRSIDSTLIGKALRANISNSNILELVDAGRAIGMLTSDGLTTILKNGTVVATGSIIELSKEDGPQVMGGGRTQAAVSASAYGLAIKVSEDGPITVYESGRLLLGLDR